MRGKLQRQQCHYIREVGCICIHYADLQIDDVSYRFCHVAYTFTEKFEVEKSKSRDFASIPEHHVTGLWSGLGSAPPNYCWPSFIEVEMCISGGTNMKISALKQENMV